MYSPLDVFNSSERGSKTVAKIQSRKYEPEAWSILIKEAAQKNIQDVRPFYEELVKIFPTCGRYWRAYIDHEMKLKRYDKVGKLFKNCLIKVLNIDLWRCYLNYVKEANAEQPNFKDTMSQAYEFALEKIGLDISSYTLWNDYVQFLKEAEVDGSYMENQKITAVRRAYQRGVATPMIHIESLWKDYIAYEQSINPIIADRMIQDRSRDYMNARRVAKECEINIRGLNRSMPSVPPCSSAEELRQVEIWRKYIQWEKSNPLRTEDHASIIRRVVYAYEQCLLCLAHHPDIWYEYATYLEEQHKLMSDKGDVNKCKQLLEDIVGVYERAINGVLRDNLLLHFAYADFEEARNQHNKALDVYNKLIDQGHQGGPIDITLVYIQLMKFTRRTEGIKAARLVFKRAREDTYCKHQIYTAAALMEYLCTKDQVVACRIFELGLKKFNSIPDYILSYVNFISHLNEENNTRVLFERVLTTGSLQPTDSVEIWNSFLEFESNIGDLSSIVKIERRRAQALEKILPNCTETSWIVDRYKFQDLLPCSLAELKSIGYDARQAVTIPSSIQLLLSSLGGLGSSHFNTTAQVQGPNSVIQGNNLMKQGRSNAVSGSRTFANSRSHNGSNNGSHNLNGGFDNVGSPDNYMIGDNMMDDSICLPDLSQMLPFKPTISPIPGSHTVPGGVFPPPPAVGSIMARLPQPNFFWGPFVDIDELINIFRNTDFDQLYQAFVEARREAKRVKRDKSSRPGTE
ncbi:Cleavage stimulation factor subunit 3, partial [Fragariocoptes setiger]